MSISNNGYLLIHAEALLDLVFAGVLI